MYVTTPVHIHVDTNVIIQINMNTSEQIDVSPVIHANRHVDMHDK